MMAEKNTAQFWDNLWQKPGSEEKDLFKVRKEERLIRWQRIEAMVFRRFGSFQGLSVIEIGAGTGTNAALMAERGARVTVLDYSPTALDRSARLFERLGISAEFVEGDALALQTDLEAQYDVSMSFGLAEHFTGEARKQIIKAHLNLLKANGLALVSVPNSANLPYRLHKWITERTRAWSVGEEYPFSRRELTNIAQSLGVQQYGFFGDSLWKSKRFLNPLKWLPRKKRKRVAGGKSSSQEQSPPRRLKRRLPRVEKGTPWDQYISYALVLWVVSSDHRQ
jgi:2-polyprenyl-3-methyl-5-hydroxy-6-metoxy-1,4-benzoquinol methylase